MNKTISHDKKNDMVVRGVVREVVGEHTYVGHYIRGPFRHHHLRRRQGGEGRWIYQMQKFGSFSDRFVEYAVWVSGSRFRLESQDNRPFQCG